MIGDTTERRSSISTASNDTREGSFLRWAGWSGIIGTLAFIATIVMTTGGVAAPAGPGDIARFLDAVAANGPTEYVYGTAGIALSVLYIPMAFGVYRMLERTTAAWYGTAAVVVGLAVLLPAYVINLLAPFAFVPLGATLGGAGVEALYADYEIARAVAEIFFTVGSLLSLAFGPLAWGNAWLRSSARRWLGWTAILTGITGMIWFVWLIDDGLIGIVLMVNVLASLVFFTGASVVLVARGGSSRLRA